MSSAKYFGPDYIFKCRLKRDVSILWITNEYDQKVINYLKREFSKNILTGDISKAIPRNKHLTKNELIHLVNYRCNKDSNPRTHNQYEKWWQTICSIRQQLQIHKYDGVGELDDLIGLAIFNPSLVEPIKLFEVFKCGEKPLEDDPRFREAVYSLREMNKPVFIRAIYRYYKEYVDPSNELNDPLSKEDIKEWEYIRSLQERYSRENKADLYYS